jgi:hypothetical protein
MLKIDLTNEQGDDFLNLIQGSESRSNFISARSALSKLSSKKTSKCSFEHIFLTLYIKYFEKIILMKPEKIELWIKRIDKYYSHKFYNYVLNEKKQPIFQQTEFGKELINTLNYEKLQSKILKKFFHRYQIKTCYYCNCNYTLTFKNEGKESVKFQIDHIFPQKKYPYFSISMYNLIPSCSNCNLNKNDANFWISDYCHPYLESIADRFKFTLSKMSDGILYKNIKEVNSEDLSISITNLTDKKVQNHNDLFDISGIYSNFGEIAKEIITLGSAYPESKRSELLHSFPLIFIDEKTMDRTFLRVYPEKSKINERPLSKFIQDIARFSDFYDDK